jgi:hypothetical protein
MASERERSTLGASPSPAWTASFGTAASPLAGGSTMPKNKEFQVHMLNEQGKARAGKIAGAFDALLDALVEINPGSSREMAIVRTKLEEASFFAKKAMASQPENCEPPSA